MAFRTDVSVDWSTSPRIITVAAPSTEITLQDLVDTCRELEQQQQNMTFPHLIDAAGKEPLGGGVTVGITATLQNAVVAFEPRTISDSAGSVTTTDTNGILLTDSSGTFISDGIVPGDTIGNVTDGSMSTVVEVISETQLRSYPLADGIDNQYDFGDSYKIWNKIQCEITGGNLVAVDEVGADISAVMPTAQVYLVRTSSSSATLQELDAIQYSSYGGGVHVDVLSAITGTNYPAGTAEYPVNNMADAHEIAEEKGFRLFYIRGDLTLTTEVLADGYIFVGQSETLTTITIQAGADVTNCEFRGVTVTGTLDGGNTIRNSLIQTINFVNGFIIDCGIVGTCTLGGGTEAHFVNCHSGVPGGSTPTLDMGGSGNSLLVRNYSGGLKIQNRTGTDAVSIDMLSGQLVIDSTVTAGTVIVRGLAKLVNNATGTAVVDVSGLVFADQIQLSSFNGLVHIDTVAGTSGTTFPLGTAQYPVDNWADAETIANNRGITEFHVTGTFIIGASDVVDSYSFIGDNELTSVVVLTSGCSTAGSRFSHLVLTGTLDGGVYMENVGIQSLLGIGSDDDPSLFLRCILLEGTCAFRSGLTTPQNIQFVECVSGVSTGSGTVLNFNGTTSRVAFRKWAGNATITNYTGGQTSVFELDEGDITLDATSTTGVVIIRGIGELTDNSTLTVTDLTLSRTGVAKGVWDADPNDHQIADTFSTLTLGKLNTLIGLS